MNIFFSRQIWLGALLRGRRHAEIGVRGTEIGRPSTDVVVISWRAEKAGYSPIFCE